MDDSTKVVQKLMVMTREIKASTDELKSTHREHDRMLRALELNVLELRASRDEDRVLIRGIRALAEDGIHLQSPEFDWHG